MTVFLIVLAVLVLLFAFILSLSAELTLIFDNGWTTRVKVLFFEKDIELSKILSFLLFPEKAAADVAEERKTEKNTEEKETPGITETPEEQTDTSDTAEKADKNADSKQEKAQKPNMIKKILDDDGIVGILLLVSNLLQTAGSAINTLIKGLHIYSLYVKIIVGGGDAADIAQNYGTICGIYYPLKGMISSSMKVDQYDDYITADFIAPSTEYEFQFIGSINVALLLKVALKAVKVFLVNLIKNK